MSTRLETKPGASWTSTGVLPIFRDAASTASQVSWLVASPRMTSTSCITGTGFMKCIPITFSGREVAVGREPAQGLIALLGRELPLADQALEALADLRPAALQRLRHGVDQDHLVAALGRHLGDAMPHGARADHADCLDGLHLRRPLPPPSQESGGR